MSKVAQPRIARAKATAPDAVHSCLLIPRPSGAPEAPTRPLSFGAADYTDGTTVQEEYARRVRCIIVKVGRVQQPIFLLWTPFAGSRLHIGMGDRP